MSRPIIEVRNLSKKYRLGAIGATSIREQAARVWDRFRGVPHPDPREYWALRDVSFDIHPGEVVGVIGRNGAGKSTLLKILSRITEPTSGTARIRGRVASLLEVGTGFHPELTGRENVYLNGAILGMTRAEVKSKFDEIVAFAEIDQFIDTPVKRYSSGMYVRLAFAVAAHLEPEILIIDEVLAVGDAQFQQKCTGKMRSVSMEEGRTVLFVSHNLKAIRHFCGSAILLNAGHLRTVGSASSVADEYLHLHESRNGESPGVAFSDELCDLSLRFDPAVIRTGDEFCFSLKMTATDDCTVMDIHVFLHNYLDERVAMLDFRDPSAPNGVRRILRGAEIQITGLVKGAPISEGIYRAGLCIRTSKHFTARYDLGVISVTPSAPPTGLIPYAQEYQGTTVLNYHFDFKTQ